MNKVEFFVITIYVIYIYINNIDIDIYVIYIILTNVYTMILCIM